MAKTAISVWWDYRCAVQGFVDSVRKSNLAASINWAKRLKRPAPRPMTEHDAEGGRKAEAGKGPGKAAGGHSGRGTGPDTPRQRSSRACSRWRLGRRKN
jgi:hypothetical protein